MEGEFGVFRVDGALVQLVLELARDFPDANTSEVAIALGRGFDEAAVMGPGIGSLAECCRAHLESILDGTDAHG